MGIFDQSAAIVTATQHLESLPIPFVATFLVPFLAFIYFD
jgi:hypothetical protein